MYKIKESIKKSGAVLVMMALAFGLGFQGASAAPNWDVSGDYEIDMNYLGTDYAHDMSLEMEADGSLSGSGGSPAGANVYTWEITSGSVDGNSIEFDANYTATSDAVTPQTVLHVEGTIAADGTISGIWSDNYQGGTRAGTWESTSGAAVEIEEDPETVTVTIVKYVDGEMADGESIDNESFAMVSSWDADNIGAGSGNYSLASTNSTPYTAVTTEMSSGADYSTHEVANDRVGESCDAGDEPFAIGGYTSGNTLEEAENATLSDESPAFTNLTNDKYVIVWNDDCSTPEDAEGDLEGDVVDGEGELEVTSIETLDSTAVANGTYEDGWKYRFNITVPTDETGLAMKFSDWVKSGDAEETIAVANNMRISSEQDDHAGTVTVTAENTYTIPNLDMEDDLDAEEDGIQVQVLVEVKVPSGTENGSYSTDYGIRTE